MNIWSLHEVLALATEVFVLWFWSYAQLRPLNNAVVVTSFWIYRLLFLALSANLGLLSMPHPGMGPIKSSPKSWDTSNFFKICRSKDAYLLPPTWSWWNWCCQWPQKWVGLGEGEGGLITQICYNGTGFYILINIVSPIFLAMVVV